MLVQGLPTGLKTARIARQGPRGETAQRRRRRCQIAPRAPATLKAGKSQVAARACKHCTPCPHLCAAIALQRLHQGRRTAKPQASVSTGTGPRAGAELPDLPLRNIGRRRLHGLRDRAQIG